MSSPLLRTSNLSRDFGGVHAVQDVSIEFMESRIHAVIGPNGAGKTTLINLLSGDILPSRGSIYFQDTDITGAAPQQIARLGIGRSYQQIHIIGDMTCRENCRLGAQARQLHGIRFLRPADAYGDSTAYGRVRLAGLTEFDLDVTAKENGYGEGKFAGVQLQYYVDGMLAKTVAVALAGKKDTLGGVDQFVDRRNEFEYPMEPSADGRATDRFHFNLADYAPADWAGDVRLDAGIDGLDQYDGSFDVEFVQPLVDARADLNGDGLMTYEDEVIYLRQRTRSGDSQRVTLDGSEYYLHRNEG